MCHICYNGTPGVILCGMCGESACESHAVKGEPKSLCELCENEKMKLETKISQDVGGSYNYLTQFGGFMQGLLDINDPRVKDEIESFENIYQRSRN